MFKFDSPVNVLRDIIGYASTRDNFPENWKKASNFTRDARLSVAGISIAQNPQQARCGVNFARVMDKLAGNAEEVPTMAMYGNTLYVEMDTTSPKPEDKGSYRVFAWDLQSDTFSAGLMRPNAAEFVPVGIAGSAKGGKVAFLLTLMVGSALKSKGFGNKTAVHATLCTLLTTFTALLDTDPSSNYVEGEDTSSVVISLQSLLYEAMKLGTLLEKKPWDGDNAFPLLRVADIQSRAVTALNELYPGLVPESTKQPHILALATSTSAGSEKNNQNSAPQSTAKSETGAEIMARLREELRIPLIGGRVLTADEKAMIPVLDGDRYVVDTNVERVVRNLHDYWDELPDLGLAANVILAGDSGSGKTQGARFAADVLHRPYTKETMSPMMEDIIGGFYPCYDDLDSWSDVSDTDKKVIHMLEERIRVSTGVAPKGSSELLKAIRNAFSDDDIRADIRSAYGIPTADEILFDPETSWSQLDDSGSEMPSTDVMLTLASERADNMSYRLLNILLDKSESSQVSYPFIESEVIKAFRNGWLVEIQEAASILRPGVLNQLNSLLEPNGSFELPNGKRIRRHPDTIVVITTNVAYEGNVRLNESLMDRMVNGRIMNNPTPEVMASRLLARVNNRAGKAELSYNDALTAAKAMSEIAAKAKELNISGEFGMRSLLFWGIQLRDGKRDIETFLESVLYKMMLTDEDIDVLKMPYENSAFARSISRTI